MGRVLVRSLQHPLLAFAHLRPAQPWQAFVVLGASWPRGWLHKLLNQMDLDSGGGQDTY